MTDWTVPFFQYGWAALFLGVLVLELYAIWWQAKRGDGTQCCSWVG